MEQDVLNYFVGVIGGMIVFIAIHRLWFTSAEKALFTRMEKMKYTFANLLIGGLFSFALFMFLFESMDYVLLMITSAVFAVMSIALGLVIYLAFEKWFLKTAEVYYFHDLSANKKYYIIHKLNDSELLISESPEKNAPAYIQEMSFFYRMPLGKAEIRK